MILLTGGSGKLGSKLRDEFPEAYAPYHTELDITRPPWKLDSSIDTVIHCAAALMYQCEHASVSSMVTNVMGTANLVRWCYAAKAKLVYISTDYVFQGDKGFYSVHDTVNPFNYYGKTKLAGEYVVQALSDYLIIRLSFYPDVFPYEKANADQWTTRIPLTMAARNIARLVREGRTGIIHLHGLRQTVYEYAMSTKHSCAVVEPCLRNANQPIDTSLVGEMAK